VKKKAVFLERQNKELTQKTAVQEKTIANLRAFVGYINNDLEQYKHKDFREGKFWKDIMAEHVI